MYNINKITLAIAFLCLPMLLFAQARMVPLTVSDSEGNVLPDVSVISENGSTLGTTNVLGLIELDLSVGDNVVLEKDGYASTKVSIKKSKNNFRLEDSYINTKAEIGLQQERRRRDITSGVSSISGDVIRRNSTTNASLALYGLLPGLLVEDKTGEFGDFNTNMFVRGRATMGSASNTPLVYIDGFERKIDEVALDDIETISVLKDAAATAIYGMRGSNGVIMIDTKRGTNGKIKFDVAVEQGFQTPTRIPDFVNSATYAEMYNQGLVNNGLDPMFSQEDIDGYAAGPSLLYPDNQWQDILIKDMAPVTELNVSADGGNSVAQYYVSLGYVHNEGLFDRTEEMSEHYSSRANYDRMNFRANLDVQAIENLDVKLDVSGMVTERNAPRNASSGIWGSVYTRPQHLYPMFLPNGELGGLSGYQNNPMGYLNDAGYRAMLDRYVNTNMSATYHFRGALDGLSVGLRYAYDNRWFVRQLFSKSFSVQELEGLDDAGNPIYGEELGYDTSLSYGIGLDEQSRRENFETFLTYKRTFGAGHGVDAVVIYHQDKLITDQYEPLGTQYISGILSYNYKSRYLADVAFSYSGSEIFADGNRFELFPAVSLAWVLSEENFLSSSRAVDFLKLRTSAGVSGNATLGSGARFSYTYTSNTSGGQYYFGNPSTSYTGRTPGRLPNPIMEPEKSFKFDFGFETQLYNSLYVAANYFFEKRYDILFNPAAEISSTLGTTMANVNSGITHTNGLEASINYNKKLNADWGINTSVNLTWFKDEVKDKIQTLLPPGSEYQYHEGHTVSSSLGLISEGLFQSEEEVLNSPTQMFGSYGPGDIKYKDVNGDGLVDDYDRVYDEGYSIPNFDLGWNIGVTWKNLELNAFLHYQTGSDIYLGNASNLAFAFNGTNRMTQWIADRNPWTEANAAYANYPKLSTNASANNFRRSDYWMVDGSRLRLRQLELRYSLPKLASRLSVDKVQFYLRGMNLFSIDNLDFLDPAAMNSFPMLRSYFIGCNIKI